MNGEKYLDLLQEVMPSCPRHFYWMDDNAPAHRAQVVQQWLADDGCHKMSWPAQSLGLNPIENAWSELKRRLEGKHMNNLEKLWHAALTEWNLLGADYLRNLVNSMPRRMEAVVKAKGGYIKY